MFKYFNSSILFLEIAMTKTLKSIEFLRRSDVVSDPWTPTIFSRGAFPPEKSHGLYACSKVYSLTRAYQEVSAQVSSQVLTF